ncbi:hypothetical protein RHGRI_014245 [Rhododendron griersonianum]|uniref:Uncharacterized protein n=1 Tax=Rhododendron griersonianum TaxID=479676 RepID=A0AAV6K902_9ERIC|nr:hypothetical protein RHGRI_014245 [Rhododendron griersonianum]
MWGEGNSPVSCWKDSNIRRCYYIDDTSISVLMRMAPLQFHHRIVMGQQVEGLGASLPDIGSSSSAVGRKARPRPWD